MTNALIIDDEEDICEMVKMALTAINVQCDSVICVKDAIKIMKEKPFDLVFCDVRLPDGDGLDMLCHINKNYPGIPVCIMTAHGSMDMAIRALKLGANDFINKPFSLKQLRSICKTMMNPPATSAHRYKHKNAALSVKKEKDTVKKSMDSVVVSEDRTNAISQKLIGKSKQIEEIRQVISKVSGSAASVFIHGESGTGKEVVARCIHENSLRSQGPFVAVNCGAIPENLVESEFFGYKKGAFTGADNNSDGLFVSANGGTIFLDEVADLPLAMQVKLLRAIQEKAVRPIGASKEVEVDVRIISATHKDLEQLVKEGSFREDLFYRLNVIAINLPSLRERQGDIEVLTEFLLQKLSSRAGKTKVSLSSDAKELLLQYDFPGNVRELENIIERALTFMEKDVITANDIQIGSVVHTGKSNHVEESNVGSAEESSPKKRELKDRPAAEKTVISSPPTKTSYTFSLEGEEVEAETETETETSLNEEKDNEEIDVSDEKASSKRKNSADYSKSVAIVSDYILSSVELEQLGDTYLFEDSVNDYKRKLIEDALKQTKGKKRLAAKKLGLNYRAFLYQLRILKIE